MLAALAVNAGFRARGEAATYTPPGGGTAIGCLVIVDRGAEIAAADDGRPRAGQVSIDVRASEIATPAHQGTFTVTATNEVFRVQNRPKKEDGFGLVWTMMAVPPS